MSLGTIQVHRTHSVLQISYRCMMYIDDGINDRGINYNVIVGSVLKKIIQISILSSVAFFAV